MLPVLCPFCRRQAYSSDEARILDAISHRDVCIPFDIDEDKPYTLTLSAILRPGGVRSLLGPVWNGSQWSIKNIHPLLYPMCFVNCIKEEEQDAEVQIVSNTLSEWPTPMDDPKRICCVQLLYSKQETNPIEWPRLYTFLTTNSAESIHISLASSLASLKSNQISVRHQGLVLMDVGVIRMRYLKAGLPLWVDGTEDPPNEFHGHWVVYMMFGEYQMWILDLTVSQFQFEQQEEVIALPYLCALVSEKENVLPISFIPGARLLLSSKKSFWEIKEKHPLSVYEEAFLKHLCIQVSTI